MKQSFASLPLPFRKRRASGAVLDSWVSLLLFLPRKPDQPLLSPESSLRSRFGWRLSSVIAPPCTAGGRAVRMR